ncbi:lysoplasmalogenase family protein [Acidovorax radicis]|uniref:lysoplasmalogenase family protein n=1 Tax=Acidovorax radicis TaxID=758826 RepID=UPI001CFAB896|nr:lysoplasmalogenase family protein [Acidovorax radicis]UCU99776.1 sterol desaturase family protein [Acidovorax radicis]
MSPSQIIVLATPVFLVLIAIELAIGWRRQRNTYRLADAVSSISLGMLSQTSAVFTRLLRIGIYTAVFEHVALWRGDAFWLSAPGWLLALVFYDLCYYWLHRMGHESAVLWAAHAVHHQSQDYNLSTALRQTSSGALLGWVFYVPMALAGVPPLVFAVVALIDLLYQFWVHTEQVGRLGWFDRWFCSPSNHRVHHAVNDAYLDKNYGGILIVWDRMFGTFKDEDAQEKCVYGTRGLLNSWDPLWANAQVYAGLAHDSWHARNWADKLRVWLKPPGWRPADVSERFPKPSFSMAQMLRYHPPMSRAVQGFAVLQFAALLTGVAAFLWQADSTPLADNALWFAVLLVAQWALGAVMQGRIGMLQALMLQSGALATATSALGFTQWHWLFKPLTMVIALILVAISAYSISARGRFESKSLYLMGAALAGSLAGDVFLMLDGFFIPGLVSFLVAHLFYVALFKRGQRWFPHRGALAATLGIGVAMYAFLWTGGLPAALRAPVAAYVLVIALMAAQAIGRATVLRDAPALWVALGAGFFMVSDSLLATHRFVVPLPLSSVWVLATYYAAQGLIVTGWLRGLASAPTHTALRTGAAEGTSGTPTSVEMGAPHGAPGTLARS